MYHLLRNKLNVMANNDMAVNSFCILCSIACVLFKRAIIICRSVQHRLTAVNSRLSVVEEWKEECQKTPIRGISAGI